MPILNDEKQIVRVLSERDILEFILRHEDELSLRFQDKNRTVFELDIVQGIGKLTVSQTIASGIPKVARIGALAVVDSFGVFIGELSAQHFRSLSIHNFKNVYKTIAEWKSTFKTVTAREDVTLSEVMTLMGKHHVSRVWILDPNDRPIGVVRCQDVLTALIPE